MRLITKMLKQWAVYWPKGSEESGGVDFDAYGRPVWGTAYEIKCRWEECLEEIIDPNMIRRMSSAQVYLASDVYAGGVLWLGRLANVTDASNPKNNDGAFEVVKFEKIPTLKATQWVRIAYL